MEVYLTASVGRKVWSFSWCALNRGFPLNESFTVFTSCLRQKPERARFEQTTAFDTNAE